MGSNNSKQKNELYADEQNTAQHADGKKNKQSLPIKASSSLNESQFNLNPNLKKKERKKIEKLVEEFKSIYPELQNDGDFNPLTMDLAISQGLHINYVREATRIRLQFTPILKKSSLLEVKLLHLEKEFWRREYKVVSYLTEESLMTISVSGKGYRVSDLPKSCGYPEFELERVPDGDGKHQLTFSQEQKRARSDTTEIGHRVRAEPARDAKCRSDRKGRKGKNQQYILQRPSFQLLLLEYFKAETGES